jgi:peptide deformylase
MGLTNEEKTLINSGGANEPFRTLLTTNTEDSLILRQKSQPIAFKKDAADLKLLIARLKATLEYDHLRGILFIDKLCE